MTDEQPTTSRPEQDVDAEVDADVDAAADADDSLDDEALATGQTTSSLGVSAGGGDATLEAYDLDHDGKVSVVEGARAQLGIVDARLEEIGERPGVIGRIAEAAHHLVDHLDNDDETQDEGGAAETGEIVDQPTDDE